MSECITEIDSDVEVKSEFSTYGEYVNLHRHVPDLFDGLKPSYRRVILAAMNSSAAKEFTKVSTIVGNTMMMYHPHGNQSIEPVVSELVHAGIFKGKGNHGKFFLIDEDAPAAAPRYIEAKMSPNYYALLSPLIRFVPSIINDLQHKEEVYLPVPIPLGLTFGYLGIAVGTGCHIPSFTPKSILNAYLNNDPYLLEQSDGLIIENKDELKRLWTEGRGHIKYRINTYRDGGKVVVEGEKGPLKLDWTWIKEQESDGRVGHDDETTTISKLSFYKMPKVQFPTIDEIEERVNQIVKGSESYYIRVVYNKQVRDIGLYNWIDITYKNYVNLYNKYLKDEISKLEFDIKVFENFRAVADKIINSNDSLENIAKSFKLDIEVVKAIGNKSINTLRTLDPSKKIPELKSKIKELKKFNVNDMIKKNVDMM